MKSEKISTAYPKEPQYLGYKELDNLYHIQILTNFGYDFGFKMKESSHYIKNQDPLCTIHLRQCWFKKVVTKDDFLEQMDEVWNSNILVKFTIIYTLIANGSNENNFCT